MRQQKEMKKRVPNNYGKKELVENVIDGKKVNLWNVNEGKTRASINYVENLEAPEVKVVPEDISRVKRFLDKQRIALAQPTANAILEGVGYKFGQRPDIYEEGE